VIPWTDALDRIRRECGDDPLFPEVREVKRDVWGEPERKARVPHPKVEIRLFRP
jgi:hypothetical protein